MVWQMSRVAPCQSPQLFAFSHSFSIFLNVLKTIGDPVFGDSCVDDQFGHSVLMLVLAVSTLLSFPHRLHVKVLERVDCLRWSWQLLFSNLLKILVLMVHVLVLSLD